MAEKEILFQNVVASALFFLHSQGKQHEIFSSSMKLHFGYIKEVMKRGK